MIAESWRVTAPYIDGTLLFIERDELAARRRAAILQRQGFEPRIERDAARLRLVSDNTHRGRLSRRRDQLVRPI